MDAILININVLPLVQFLLSSSKCIAGFFPQCYTTFNLLLYCYKCFTHGSGLGVFGSCFIRRVEKGKTGFTDDAM